MIDAPRFKNKRVRRHSKYALYIRHKANGSSHVTSGFPELFAESREIDPAW